MKLRRFFVCALLACSALLAQEYRGTFSGNVTDPQGAVIPNTKITITETRTGTKTTTVSGPTGKYHSVFLALGTYNIEAEAAGFKKSTQKGLTLSSGENPVIDIHLEVGNASEEVTVTAETPILVTANPSLGQVITTAEVEDVPINGRTPMMLDNLAMGVVSTFEPGPVRPFDNSAPNDISIGGVPATHNEVLLNGAPNAGQPNQMAYSPMQDAVTEVRVNTFDMDAANGHTMGGTVNVMTKSGTNALHGSAYIYNQTSAVDANTFFNNAKNVSRPPYHQNQYGVTAAARFTCRRSSTGRIASSGSSLGRDARFRSGEFAAGNRQSGELHIGAYRGGTEGRFLRRCSTCLPTQPPSTTPIRECFRARSYRARRSRITRFRATGSARSRRLT